MSKNGFIIIIGLLMVAICLGVYYQYGALPAVLVLIANSVLLRWIRRNVR